MNAEVEEILEKLKALSSPEAVEGMAKFGITPRRAYGVSIPHLRKIAKEIGRDHELALKLWKIDMRETRILASMIDEPESVTEKQMEEWVKEFDYWEICDQVCMNLFSRTKFACKKAVEWSGRDEEYVKRAAFALMAWMAFKRRDVDDGVFESFLPIIRRESTDNRKMVRKAVNWALRQIGKRNLNLNRKAMETAHEILRMNSKAAEWIARDAIRELASEKVQERLRRKESK